MATELAGMRQRAGCGGGVDETGVSLSYRGRPAVEFRGRDPEDDSVRDFAFYDLAAARIVSYVCFENVSLRQAGEPIISLPEVSADCDRITAATFPGANLTLESIQRYRPNDEESVYYEAHYAPPATEAPFFEPPVRMLLNASTGALFRIDIDPEWLAPAPLPRTRISAKAAERVAAVVLKDRDLAPVLGPGAVFAQVAPAELYMVRPNDWLDFNEESADNRSQLAWVVPFLVDGVGARGPHSLFVDAATGRILGGQAGRLPVAAQR